MSAIEEAFEELGREAKRAILYHLEQEGLSLNRILKYPEDLSAKLERLFGPGKVVMERLIISRLASKLKLDEGRLQAMGLANTISLARQMSKSSANDG